MAETPEKPGGTKRAAEQKASTTHKEAMRIIDAEVAARERKTERLRQARLAQEAAEPAPEPPPKRGRRKTS